MALALGSPIQYSGNMLTIIMISLHDYTAECSVPCLENNGVTLSCIAGAGSDKESDQCICDAFRGLSGFNIERCIGEVCNVKDIMDLEAYLAQACFGASVRTFPRRLRVRYAPLLSTLELTRRTSGHHDLSTGATFGR